MFERLEKIIGKNALQEIQKKKVLVVGIGGVGGYVVEALVRSGIQKIIIIDSDVVDITNKNRQIIALDSTIGKKKVEVMKDRILDIYSQCQVEALDIFLEKDNIVNIFEKYQPDYVVDACDTITTKKEIIRYCLNHDISFISSMGTGNKLNPNRLKISDIRKTSYDPLAKILRKWISDEKITKKIPVLWSDEEKIKTKDRTPGSTSFVPATAGFMIEGYVIQNILNENRDKKEF